MSAFTIKLIAIVAMTLNHIGHTFGDMMPNWLYYICIGCGGITFPVMAYFLTEGYQYTRNISRYAKRILVFALIALIPFFLTMGYSLNVLFTLFLGLMVIYLDDHMKSRGKFRILLILITVFTICCDWSIMGIPMVLCYHRIKNKVARVTVPVLITWTMAILFVLLAKGMEQREIIANLLYTFGGCTVTIPLLLSNNGKRGRSLKYCFYAYYPLHLALLAVIKYIIK